MEYLINNPDKSFDDYTELEIGPGEAWTESTMHFGIGSEKAALPCLGVINSPCPVCEAYDEDSKSEDPAIKASAKLIARKHQWDWFVEWRGFEEEGPYVWALADQWSTRMISLIANTDYNVMYDPFKGHDIRVTRTGKGMNDTSYNIDIIPPESGNIKEGSFLYETILEDDDGNYKDFDFEKGKQVLDVLPDITQFQKPILNYEEYSAILNDEKTVKEIYREKFGNSEEEDDGTSFDKEKLEKESKEKSGGRRRRR